ncbi:MAG: Tol-Pal system beta propeller repeat protein TolB [Gammaproteobacteria bacterium]|nr:Tol-Pal system beta propeller repeat protein TolB [Gammaproteobacteria bacterium]
MKKKQMRSVLWVLYTLMLDACGGARVPTFDHNPTPATVEKSSAFNENISIAIAPFEGRESGAAPLNFTAIIAADLNSSGRFSPSVIEDIEVPSDPADDTMSVEYKKWRMRGIPYFVLGKIQKNLKDATGIYAIRFQLFDAYQGEMLIGYELNAQKEDLRRRAHDVSDLIYEALAGSRGVFATRIAFVTKRRDVKANDQYAVEIADADGANSRSIVVSPEPLLAPVWSPDGRDIAYVTLETHHPQIYLQQLATGRRRLLADLTFLTSTPAWSPDGNKLALSLAQKSKPGIYVMDVHTKTLQCAICRPGITADPAWSPDGKSLVYTSDQNGSERIYQFNLATAEDRPLTLVGRRNHHPVFSPDGLFLAFIVHTEDNRDRIAVMEMATRQVRIVDDTEGVTTLSVAPNGRMLLYATNIIQGGKQKSVLYTISLDGHVKRLVSFADADIGEPAWSPWGVRNGK